MVARHHRTHGERFEEATAIAHARQAANASGLPFVKALVLTDLAIHQWFWGEDARLPETLEELERVTTPPIYEGVRHFFACCRGSGRYAPTGFEKPKIRAFSYLIAAACADDVENARWLTAAAIATADEARSMFHQVIARVAAALVVEKAQAAPLWDQAATFAERTNSAALCDAVRRLRAGQTDDHMLTHLARRFVDRDATSSVAVQVFAVQVHREGKSIHLQRRELELVLALALHGGPLSRERLMESIWPDQKSDQAQNSLKVYVNRVRNRLGHASIVLSSRGYSLAAHVLVDINDVERILRSALIHKAALNRYQYAALSNAAQADVEAIAAAAADWEWFPMHLARIESVWRDASLAIAQIALESKSWRTALHHAQRLLVFDGSDAIAREIAVNARLGMGDELGAARLTKQRV